LNFPPKILTENLNRLKIVNCQTSIRFWIALEAFLSASLGKNGTIETLILFFVYTIFCLNFACILKILLPNQVCIKKEPNENQMC